MEAMECWTQLSIPQSEKKANDGPTPAAPITAADGAPSMQKDEPLVLHGRFALNDGQE